MVNGCSEFRSDADRWLAVVERNARADGVFVYSVKTTGVYCRPSCGARKPRRENVRFHDSCDAAELVGFRACLRCRPRDCSDPVSEMVAAACRRIENLEAEVSLTELAAGAGLSPSYFQRVFKRVTGLSPKAFAQEAKAERARRLLDSGNPVTDTIYAAGYGSSGRFYAGANRSFGMKPGRYRDGGELETIRFAVGQCSLGAVLVASSDVGICSIALGDNPQVLVHDLQKRFAKARIIGGEVAYEKTVATVVGFVESPGVGLNLPLDVRGTVFQRRVWRMLAFIPAGKTMTYSEIAERLGQPSASRAVAGACAANVLAVAIPCHRVVRTDGGMSGYRWGVERKRELLRRERESVSKVPET